MPKVGLAPTKPEGGRFTVCCNCYYATSAIKSKEVGDQWDLPDIARVTHTLPHTGDATA